MLCGFTHFLCGWCWDLLPADKRCGKTLSRFLFRSLDAILAVSGSNEKGMQILEMRTVAGMRQESKMQASLLSTQLVICTCCISFLCSVLTEMAWSPGACLQALWSGVGLSQQPLPAALNAHAL